MPARTVLHCRRLVEMRLGPELAVYVRPDRQDVLLIGELNAGEVKRRPRLGIRFW